MSIALHIIVIYNTESRQLEKPRSVHKEYRHWWRTGLYGVDADEVECPQGHSNADVNFSTDDRLGIDWDEFHIRNMWTSSGISPTGLMWAGMCLLVPRSSQEAEVYIKNGLPWPPQWPVFLQQILCNFRVSVARVPNARKLHLPNLPRRWTPVYAPKPIQKLPISGKPPEMPPPAGLLFTKP